MARKNYRNECIGYFKPTVRSEKAPKNPRGEPLPTHGTAHHCSPQVHLNCHFISKWLFQTCFAAIAVTFPFSSVRLLEFSLLPSLQKQKRTEFQLQTSLTGPMCNQSLTEHHSHFSLVNVLSSHGALHFGSFGALLTFSSKKRRKIRRISCIDAHQDPFLILSHLVFPCFSLSLSLSFSGLQLCVAPLVLTFCVLHPPVSVSRVAVCLSLLLSLSRYRTSSRRHWQSFS